MQRFNRLWASPALLYLLAGSCGAFAQAASAPKAPEAQIFKPANETVEGWYHRHEIDAWVAAGADREVVDGILKRIGESKGERRDAKLMDTQIANGPGNWAYEWSQAGEAAMAEAREHAKAGRTEQANQRYRGALVYFTTGSWPHLGRPDDKAALAKAREAYLALGKLLPKPVEHRAFAVGEVQARGYLHLPLGKGPFPVAVLTNGSDVSKESNLDFFVKEFAPRGIAMFSVDMPGMGDSSGLNLLNGTDAVVSAAANYLRNLPDIDASNVYVVGVSFGGNAAARAFLTQEFAGVVSMCAPLHRPFLAPAKGFDALPALTTDGIKARIGLLDASNAELAAVSPRLSLQTQGLYSRAQRIGTPLLIVTTNADPVAPLQDLKSLQGVASDVQTIVFDVPGHCPPRFAGQSATARWIADQLKRPK